MNDRLTYEQKRKIGIKLYNFLYSFTSEGSRKFDAKYPDYNSFKESLKYPEESPIRYMEKFMDGENSTRFAHPLHPMHLPLSLLIVRSLCLIVQFLFLEMI